MTPTPDPVILLGLAERVEAATGPDRELDVAIIEALGWRRKGGFWFGEYWERGKDQIWFTQIPLITASLDAAMSLYTALPDRVPSDPRKATAEALRQRAEGLTCS